MPEEGRMPCIAITKIDWLVAAKWQELTASVPMIGFVFALSTMCRELLNMAKQLKNNPVPLKQRDRGRRT